MVENLVPWPKAYFHFNEVIEVKFTELSVFNVKEGAFPC